MSRLREERATRSSRSRGGVAARSTLLLMWDSRRRAAASPRKPVRASALPDRPSAALYLFVRTVWFGATVRSRARSPDGASLADDPRVPDRRRCRPRMHALPNLAIQLYLVGLVRLGQGSRGD